MTVNANTIDTNASQLSYAVEANLGVLPTSTFQALRFTSETLSMTKTRTRPTEINSNREAIQAVTTSLTAGGTIGYALSYATYDDFLVSAINSGTSFANAAVAIAGSAGDITITNVSNTSCTLSSTTAGKFTAINQGNWIRTLGFTNAVNNQIMYVTTKTNATSLTCTTLTTTVTETPALALAQIRQGNVRNGTALQTLYIQQKYGSALWLRYPACFVSGMTVTGGIGQMLSGSITVLAQQELSANASADTGGIVAATSGNVMNPIGGFKGLLFNESSVGIIDSFTLNIQSTGAALQYGMGSAAAQGLTQGMIEVTGNIKVYFQNFTLYTNFQNETQGRVSIIVQDSSGNAYAFQLFNAFLNNGKIDASGPNTPVYVTFDLEANPIAATGVTTISIDKLPNS